MGKRNGLPPHEWAAVLIILGLLFSLALFTYAKKPPPPPPDLEDGIVIRVVGEVENPGYYTLPRKSRAKDLIPLAVPKMDTEMVNLDPYSLLDDGQTVRFKSLLVKVRLKGAVRGPDSLKMRKGAFLGEYFDRIDFEPFADREKVRSRLIRRQNQVVTIPRKKS